MTSHTETREAAVAIERPRLGHLISTTFALSIGISIAVGVMLVAAGMWLERYN